MVKSADAFRTISEVADWLGVPAHVLRFWESKFTQIKPVKRAGGRRYYRPTDMQLLGGIRKLLHDDGMTIKGVQKILREQGVRNVASLSPPFEGDEDLYESGIALDVEQDPETHRGRVLHFGRETGEAATSLDTSDEAAPEAPDRPEEEDGATDLYAGDDSGPKEPWRAPPSLAADEDMTDPRKDPDAAAEYRPGPADEDPRSEDGPAIAPRTAATAPPSWAPAAPADDHPGHNATRGDPAARPDPAAPPPAEPNREKIWFPSDADGDSDKAAGEAAPADEPPVAGPGAYAARTEDDGPPQSDVAAGIATEEPARQAAISPLQAEDGTVSETAPASLRVTPISLPDDPPDTLPADPGALARLAGLPRPVNQETAAELAALAERLRARRPSRASTPR